MITRSTVSQCLLFLLCLLLPSLPAFSDAIIVSRAMSASTIAEFFIEKSVVRVELEIGIEDLEGFRNLMPDEIYERLGNEPKPLAERLPRFFREESAIYDVLARSVTGDLLTQTYLETRRGLELASQGGARAKVKELELVSVEPRPISGEPGFVAICTWNVDASVGHWGHIHQRKNQYQAELTVKPVDGTWKITALELIQEERL